MTKLARAHRYLMVLALIAISTAVLTLVLLTVTSTAAFAQQDTVVRVPSRAAPRLTTTVSVARICYVSTSGVVHCRDTPDLLRTDFAQTNASTFNRYMDALYRREGLPPRDNTLISCGDGVWASSQQVVTQAPAARDVQTALNSCLSALKKTVSRPTMAGRLSAFDGTTGLLSATMGGGASSGNAIVCSNVDPRRGNAKDWWEGVKAWWSSGGGKETTETIAMTIVASVPQGAVSSIVTGPMLSLASEDAARGAGEALSLLRRKYAYAYMAETNDMETVQALMPNSTMSNKEFMEFVHKRHPSSTGTNRTSANRRVAPGEASACTMVTQAAMELARRCDQSGWRSYECQKMVACVDPALIIPTEEGSVSCGGIVTLYDGDKQLRQALLKACEERARYGPGGGSSCSGFDSNTSTRDLAAAICNNPYAFVESGCLSGRPSNDAGPAPLSLVPPLQRDLQDVINWGCRELGGPCLQLPGSSPRPPTPIRRF
jgi:hypothetical protein